MENSKVTLGYWKIRGLVSPIRYLLEFCNVPYQQEFYVQGEAPEFSKAEWLDKKNTLDLDFPNLPYFIDGNLRMTESLAIMRYICKKHNAELLGKTDFDYAHVEMLAGILREMLFSIIGTHCFGTGNKDLLLEQANAALVKMVSYLGNKKFLVGDYLTYVDFLFYDFLEMIAKVSEGRIYIEFPSLKAYKENLEKLEKMAEHLKSDRYIQGPFINSNSKIFI